MRTMAIGHVALSRCHEESDRCRRSVHHLSMEGVCKTHVSHSLQNISIQRLKLRAFARGGAHRMK